MATDARKRTGEPEMERLGKAMADTRAELERVLGDLRGVMRRTLDWRAWVARHPFEAIGLCVAVGYRLGRGR